MTGHAARSQVEKDLRKALKRRGLTVSEKEFNESVDWILEKTEEKRLEAIQEHIYLDKAEEGLMTDPCPYCDVIGPDQEPMTGALRDLHRSIHDVYRTFAVAFAPLVKAIEQARADEQRITQNAYRLAGPSKGDSK